MEAPLPPPPDEAPVLDRGALVRAWREAEETKVLDRETEDAKTLDAETSEDAS